MKVKEYIRRYGVYIVLIVLIIFFTASTPIFFTSINLFNILRQVSVVGILAVGMTFVILTGGIDLSIGYVVALTGVVAASLMKMGVPPVFAIFATFLMAMGIGFINAFFVQEFRLNPLIVTLGSLTILKGASYITTGGLPVYGFPESFKIIGQGHLGIVPIPVIIMAICVWIGRFILDKTKLGRHVYGLGGNEEAARLAGVNVRKVKYFVFMFCSLMAAIAGIVLLSRVNTAQPDAGAGYELDVITGVVLGGISMSGGEGRLAGAFGGILVMAVLGNGMLLLGISDYYQWIVKGIVMLLAVSYDQIAKGNGMKLKFLGRIRNR